MKPERFVSRDDEVDLREFVSSIFARWLLVGAITLTSIAGFGYYALKLVTPLHESLTVFLMPDAEGGDGALAQISPLAGLLSGGLGSGGTSLPDLVTGRDFILELAAELGLDEDPFYNRMLAPPNAIEQLFGRPNTTPEAVQDSIVRVFLKHLELGETDDRAQVVRVKHPVADTAAQVANAVVQKAFDSVRLAAEQETRSTIAYLEEELREAERELDAAIAQIQRFAVDEDIASAGALQAQSVQLDGLRTRAAQAEAQLAALAALQAAVSGPGLNRARLARLWDAHPVLQDRETLALLQVPRSPAAWLALTLQDVTRATADASQSRDVLTRSLRDAERDAARMADAAAELALLERDAKVAAVAFEAITRQYKERSILAGLTITEGTVFETAVPALGATSPQVIIVLAVGGYFGLVVSLGVVLALFLNGTTIHSRRSLAQALGANGRMFPRRVLPWFGRLRDPSRVLRGVTSTASQDHLALAYALNTAKTPVVVAPLRQRDGPALALLAAGMLTGGGSRTLVVDLSVKPTETGPDLFNISPLTDQIDLAQPTSAHLAAPRSAARPHFADLFAGVLSDYDDGVFLLPAGDAGGYLLQGLRPLNPLVLTSVRLGKLRLRRLRVLMAQLPQRWLHRGGLLVLS